MGESVDTAMVSDEGASQLRLEALGLFEQRRGEVSLNNSRLGLRTLGPTPLLRMAFYTILKRYNSAIGDNLIKLYRHECSLRAWSSVLNDMGLPEEMMRPLFWDHVEPVLFMALDLPGAAKDQVVHAAVSLATIAHDGTIGLAKVAEWDSDRGFGWIGRFNALGDGSDQFVSLKDAVDQLWEPAEAVELRDDHGRRHHAVGRRLGVGYPKIDNTTTEGSSGYAFTFGQDKPLDLDERIELIGQQRLRAERAYEALWDYVHHLEKCGLQA